MVSQVTWLWMSKSNLTNGKHTLHDPSSLYKRCQQAMLSFQSWGGHLRESKLGY